MECIIVGKWIVLNAAMIWAVGWYCKYGISYRELEDMLCEWGIKVDHTTIYRWVQRYAPKIEKS